MQLIVIGISLLTVIFSLVNAGILSHIEQPTLETRVKHAETILFGRFNWLVPVSSDDNLNDVYSTQQNTFEFNVYCTIKKSKPPENVPRFIRIIIPNNETENDMKKNTWFVLFPTSSEFKHTWMIENRTDAFDLEDDIELHAFEKFCFLKPKLPYGFPTVGLLNRCPRPSSQHCFENGTKILSDELLELKTFLISTTTRKAKLKKFKRSYRPKSIVQQNNFIEPVW